MHSTRLRIKQEEDKPLKKEIVKETKIISFYALGTFWTIKLNLKSVDKFQYRGDTRPINQKENKKWKFHEEGNENIGDLEKEILNSNEIEFFLNEIKKEIYREVVDFENKYSRFKENSIITKISGIVGEHKVTEDFVKMLEIYFQFYEISQKKLTPLIGELLSQLGYSSFFSNRRKEKLNESKNVNIPDLIKSVEILSKDSIFLHEEVFFDFGAVGKGYLVDKLYTTLFKKFRYNLDNFIINAGGDIKFYASKNAQKKTLNVGLENPDFNDKRVQSSSSEKKKKENQSNIHSRYSKNNLIGLINLRSGFSICGSANNRRKWEKNGKIFSHIVDPSNVNMTFNQSIPGQLETGGNRSNKGKKIENTRLKRKIQKSTWVIHKSCAIADIKSTLNFLLLD